VKDLFTVGVNFFLRLGDWVRKLVGVRETRRFGARPSGDGFLLDDFRSIFF
jgi:hypothetical protein